MFWAAVLRYGPGYDHIAGANRRGGGRDRRRGFSAYLTPGRKAFDPLPDEKDVFEGVMASRVAARVGEGGSGPPAGPGA